MAEEANRLANANLDVQEIARSFASPQAMLEFFRKKNGVAKLATIEDKREIVPSDIYVDKPFTKVVDVFKTPKYTISTGRRIGQGAFKQPEEAVKEQATLVPLKLVSGTRQEELVEKYHHTSAGAKLLSMNVESALPKGSGTSAVVALVDTAARTDEAFFVVGGVVSLGNPYSTLLVAPEWSLPLNDNFNKRPAYLVHTQDENYLPGTDLATVTWDSIVESANNACPFLRPTRKWDKVVQKLAGPAVVHHDCLQTLVREPQKFLPLNCNITIPRPTTQLTHGKGGFKSPSVRINSLNFSNLSIDQPPFDPKRASSSFDYRKKAQISGVGEGPEIITFSSSQNFVNIFKTTPDEPLEAVCDTSLETTIKELYGDEVFIQKPMPITSLCVDKIVNSALFASSFSFKLSDLIPGKSLFHLPLAEVLTGTSILQVMLAEFCTANISFRVDMSVSSGRSLAFGVTLAYDEAMDTTSSDTEFAKMRGLPQTLGLAQDDRLSLVFQPGFYGNTLPLKQAFNRMGNLVMYCSTPPNSTNNVNNDIFANFSIYINSLTDTTVGMGEQPCTMSFSKLAAHSLYKAEELMTAKSPLVKIFPLDFYSPNAYHSNFSVLLNASIGFSADIVVDWIVPASIAVTGSFYLFATYGDEADPENPSFNKLRLRDFPMYNIATNRKGRLVIPMCSWLGAYTRKNFPRVVFYAPSGLGGNLSEKVHVQIQIKDFLNFRLLGAFTKDGFAGSSTGESIFSTNSFAPFFYNYYFRNPSIGVKYIIPVTPYNLIARGWNSKGELGLCQNSNDNFLHDLATSKLYWRGSLEYQITLTRDDAKDYPPAFMYSVTSACITPIGEQSFDYSRMFLTMRSESANVIRFTIPHMSPYTWLETIPPEGDQYQQRLHYSTNGTLLIIPPAGVSWMDISIRPGPDFAFSRHRRHKIKIDRPEYSCYASSISDAVCSESLKKLAKANTPKKVIKFLTSTETVNYSSSETEIL
nr:MAG: polyprotein [Pteropus rufus cheravirus]